VALGVHQAEVLLFNRIKLWYNYSGEVWTPLFLGWLCLPLVTLIPKLTLDRAGALLICSVVIAEVFNKKGHRAVIDFIQPASKPNYTYREVVDESSGIKNIEVTLQKQSFNQIYVNSESFTLYLLASDKEFQKIQGSRLWNMEKTVNRLDKTVEYSLAFSVFIGTILWAFG
jgi:hypothetical protein